MDCSSKSTRHKARIERVHEAFLKWPEALGEADTIIVPGLADPAKPIPEDVLKALRAAAESGTQGPL